MDFSFIQNNISNLTNSEIDVVQFSIIGMTIVFGGLSLIAIYIKLLPKFLLFLENLSVQKKAPKKQEQDEIDGETILAIATAVHLHQFSSDDNQKITWERHEIWDSSWQRAGRFESMIRHGQ